MKTNAFRISTWLAFVLAVGCQGPRPQWTDLPGANHPAIRSLARIDHPGGVSSGVVVYSGREYSVVLSCGHVAATSPKPTVSGYWPQPWQSPGRWMALDITPDLALLVVMPPVRLVPAVIGARSDCRIGLAVRGVGVAAGKGPWWINGEIMGNARQWFDEEMLVVNAYTIPGMSGGPLMDVTTSRVLGVISRIAGKRVANHTIPEGHIAGIVPCWVIRAWARRQGIEL